jgi:L-amino acid N-acyltransferase YncA
MIEIRAARAADAEGIARVHVTAWQEAYVDAFPAEYLTALDPADRVDRWRRIIEDDAEDVRVAVDTDTDTDTVVGWATSGYRRDPDGPRTLELNGIYLLGSYHGSGAGQGLIDAALGERPAYLWVLEVNPRAQAFYLRNRFAFDGGARTDHVGGHPVSELRMVR